VSTPRFLGLDFGTSGARACVIAPGGQIEAMERVAFGSLQDHELSSTWEEALTEVISRISSGLRRKLAAIAVDGTSGTVLACNEALEVTHPPLLYNDARAIDEAAAIAKAAGADHPAASASSGLAKMLWLKRRLGLQRARLYLNQADWLTAKLSGLPGVSDYHNALKMGFDLKEKRWPYWVEYLADVDYLPNVVPPGSPIARLSRPLGRSLGIDGDCLVRAGTTDSIAAFLAADARAPGEAVTSLGTTLVLKLVSRKPVESGAYGIYSHWYGDLWLAGGASNAGGGVLLAHFSADELDDLSDRIDPKTDSGLDYYPLPGKGERFPINDPDMTARLEPRPENRLAFLHGLLEGLARIEALGYHRLQELGADPVSRVTSAGGGARNPALTRIRQRLLGVPVETAPEQEAAYGTARLALMGPQLFPGAGHA
jgi:sugar (pentulose or hexulose) kinase